VLGIAMKRKRPSMLRSCVIVLHENARPHAVCIIWDTLRSTPWKVLNHRPYIPNLSPWLLHIFTPPPPPQKKETKGHRFQSDEDVKAAVVLWLQQQPREFFTEGIHWLVCQWGACLNAFVRLFLTASTLASRTILERISFEQASNFPQPSLRQGKFYVSRGRPLRSSFVSPSSSIEGRPSLQ
jgi:hypothetical protein